MKYYADTSFLLALYREQKASPVANEIMQRVAAPLPLTPLVFLELRSGLNLALFRGDIDADTRRAAWAQIEQDIRDGVLSHVAPAAAAVYDKAAELSDRHGPSIGARTLDVLHVAAALILSASRLLSLDQRQRALAAKVGLTVAP